MSWSSLLREAAVVVSSWAALAAGVRGQEGAVLTDDFAALTAGVVAIASPGVPGPIAVFGPAAFPVIAGGKADERGTVVAAARFGKGRVVLFGHGGYFDAKAIAEATTGRLLENAVRWCAAGKAVPRVRTWRAGEVKKHLESSGLEVGTMAEGLMEGSTRGAWASDADVVIFDTSRLATEEDAARVAAFVKGGGGVVATSLGWGWLQTHPGKRLDRDHLGNRAFAEAGLAWADDTTDQVEPAAPEARLLWPLHAAEALRRLGDLQQKPAKDEIKALLTTVERAAVAAPATDTLWRPALKTALASETGKLVPTATHPIRLDCPLARLALRLERDAEDALPPGKRIAHPAAPAFPGAVPSGARPSVAQISVAPGAEGWISTGVYAAAGGAVKVTVEGAGAVAAFAVQIGCHSDRLWRSAVWNRHPEVTREYSLTGETTVVASPFGGLVYLVAKKKDRAGAVGFKIEGAFQAPRFVLGTTSLEDWRTTIRNAPAPWAEFETAKVILTCESKHVRELDDPAALLAFWDGVLDLYAELGMRPLPRRAERIVNDVQISAGYMHSGYPIMTHLDVGAKMLDIAALKKGSTGWGFWHELGHNHQKGAWTFSGTGEVTNNLFSLFVVERVAGVTPFDGLRERKVLERAKAFLAGSGTFEEWKKDPFLALVMYVQVIDAFGWPAIQKAFAAYRDDPAHDPKDDAEKRDLWLLRLSEAANADLGPFFTSWRIPTSPEARAKTAAFLPWTPTPLL